MPRRIAIAISLLIVNNALSQQHFIVLDSITHDSLSQILHRHGHFEGHIRSYSMSTINYAHNPDYYAQGIGGGLAYYSPIIKRFQVGLSGFIIFNIHSSELAEKNGFSSRYEIALFDITDAGNHEDLDRLENLYLRYYLAKHNRGSFIQVGKFQLNTPLLNMQDSRMRPNTQEGIWAELKLSNSVELKGGWLWKTSPRSTIRWYGIGESVGIYGNGRATNGYAAKYHGYIESKGIGILNVKWAPSKEFTYQIWNYYADNLFNLLLHKTEISRRYYGVTVFAGAQYLWQKSHSPKNLPITYQYITPDEASHVISLKIGVSPKSGKQNASLNYTRITAHGRFLFPREWGTETLYTFISRERNEGSGDVHAWMVENSILLGKNRQLNLQAMAGIYKMPPVLSFALNKYSMPSYYHLALKTRYRFAGFLNGLAAQALYVYKGNLKEIELDTNTFHNKVKMHHAAIVMDYLF